MTKIFTITNEKEALTIACFMEERAIEIYTRALMVIKNEEVQKVIKELLGDEKEHLLQFKGFLADEKGKEEPPEADKKNLLKAYAGEFVFKGGLLEAQREGAFTSGEAAIGFAVKEEEKAVEKYREFGLLCEDEEAKKTFLAIAQEELMHKKQLEKQLAK